MSKSKAGGGIRGKNVRQKSEATREKPNAKAINPAHVAQVGKALAEKPEDWRNGPTHNTRTGFGNEMAEKVQRRPGGSRTVMASGTQGAHGGSRKEVMS
jgi:hypothetical protein